MLWKTRGTARREAQGEKQVKRYASFSHPMDKRIEGEIEGTLHTDKDCETLKETPGTFTFIQTLLDFADKFDDELVVNHKIGRGAWVKVKLTHRCPICFEGNS